MPKKDIISHADVIQESRKDEDFRREYRLSKPKYDIARQVINLRHEYDWTQTELAKKAKTHQSRISKIEAGEFDVRLSTLARIAEALDAEVEIKISPQPSREFYRVVQQVVVRTDKQKWNVAESKNVLLNDGVFK